MCVERYPTAMCGRFVVSALALCFVRVGKIDKNIKHISPFHHCPTTPLPSQSHMTLPVTMTNVCAATEMRVMVRSVWLSGIFHQLNVPVRSHIEEISNHIVYGYSGKQFSLCQTLHHPCGSFFFACVSNEEVEVETPGTSCLASKDVMKHKTGRRQAASPVHGVDSRTPVQLTDLGLANKSTMFSVFLN